MVRCARVIGVDVPGFGERFRVARPRSDHAVLMVGRSFVRQAAGYESQFAACGLPDTFLGDATGAIDTYEQAFWAWRAAKRRTSTRAGLDDALSASLYAVRRLDIAITTRFQDDQVTLATWEHHRRVGHPRPRKKSRIAASPEPKHATHETGTV